MRDPLSWSFPVARLFGITVRVHLLFPIVVIGLILREGAKSDSVPGTWLDASMLMGLLFFVVLLHEFGHCFVARSVGGEATEVLLWPLGGLASVDIPHAPRAHFLTAFGGPLVNLIICVLAGFALLFVFDQQYRPTWNPFWAPYRSRASGEVAMSLWNGDPVFVSNLGVLIAARLFWVSWITFLLNVLIIGFPLDGGRMFQAILWPYVGHRQATLYAVFLGFGFMFLILLVSIIYVDPLFLLLAFYIYVSCKQEWIILETGGEEGLFGYDFSQGYTSLEREDQPAPKPRKKQPNFIQRWLQRRAARKMHKENERQLAEERRMDELLDKIQRFGKESLTEEEHRFLLKVSDRYKKK